MNILKTSTISVLALFSGLSIVSAQTEPRVTSSNGEQLISSNSLNGWQVPNTGRWSVNNGVITGDTDGEEIAQPEWIYTDDEYENFVFSVDVKLVGGRANSGIYFRAEIIDFSFRGNPSYEAPSGYEYDTIINNSNNASIGDFFGRGGGFRHRADQDLVNEVFNPNDWNRMTIRAEGNHIEYWMNGTKVNDLIDNDANRNTKGLIGIQLHDGIVMEVQFRNAFVQDLDEDTSSGDEVVTLTKSNATGFAIDGNRGGANGQNVYLWSRNTNNVNQQFIETDRGGGFFSYVKNETTFALDGGRGGARNQNLHLWSSNASNFNQQWRKVSVGNGRFQLQKRNSLGFSINGGSGGSSRQNVNLYDTINNGNLHWIIE